MTHDFKKGDYVILPDGKTGTIRSIMLCIVEVEINKHIKYVDIRTLKHYEREDRAGEAVAELETIHNEEEKLKADPSLGTWVDFRGKWVDYSPSDPWPDKPNGQAEYDKIMADGCDPAPTIVYEEGFDPADDGPEVEILRSKP